MQQFEQTYKDIKAAEERAEVKQAVIEWAAITMALALIIATPLLVG